MSMPLAAPEAAKGKQTKLQRKEVTSVEADRRPESAFEKEKTSIFAGILWPRALAARVPCDPMLEAKDSWTATLVGTSSKDDQRNEVGRTCIAEEVGWLHMAPPAEPSPKHAGQTIMAK